MDERIPIKQAAVNGLSYSVTCASGKDLPKEIQKCESAQEACKMARKCKVELPDIDYVAVLRIDGTLTKVYWENNLGQRGTDLDPSDVDFLVADQYIGMV